jgi:hypothetical protein
MKKVVFSKSRLKSFCVLNKFGIAQQMFRAIGWQIAASKRVAVSEWIE